MDFAEYLPFWNKITDADRALISRSICEKTFKKGEVLHDGSRECTGLFVVRTGQLRAYTVSDAGQEITLYRLLPRDICLFSASCIMRSIQFSVTITAQKDTEVFLMPSEVFKGIMERSAPLANFINELMADRFSEVMWLMEQVMWRSFDRRLASFLLEESNLAGSDTIAMTHEEIGRHMGNPREVVTRMLKHFATRGMVLLSRGTVCLTDRKKLEELAGS